MIRFFSRDIQKNSDELRRDLEVQRARFLAATQSVLHEVGQEFKRRPGIALGLVFTAFVLTRPRTKAVSSEKKLPSPPPFNLRTVA